MATLISIFVNDLRVGQCDARCYNAGEHSQHKCHCICGGKNHGAGESKALENTAKYSDKWVATYEKINGLKLSTKRFGKNETSAGQRQLFDITGL